MDELIVALALLIGAALFFAGTALVFAPPAPAFWLISATGFIGFGIAFWRFLG
jgi:hypothetical protein